MFKPYFIALLLVSLLASGCRTPTDNQGASLTGRWEGSIVPPAPAPTNVAQSSASVLVTLDLVQNGNSVSGSGQVAVPGHPAAILLAVTGNRTGDDVAITLNAPGRPPLDFEGKAQGGNRLAGMLRGLLATPTPLELRKQ